jgi:hypothetical protein
VARDGRIMSRIANHIDPHIQNNSLFVIVNTVARDGEKCRFRKSKLKMLKVVQRKYRFRRSKVQLLKVMGRGRGRGMGRGRGRGMGRGRGVRMGRGGGGREEGMGREAGEGERRGRERRDMTPACLMQRVAHVYVSMRSPTHFRLMRATVSHELLRLPEAVPYTPAS